jgi:signal transduction histidine kinase/ActR/RegA family two-component response regulator/PAS domain-containing protein
VAVAPIAARGGRSGGIALVLLALAAVLSGCWLLYHHEAGRIADQQREREVMRVGLLAQLMRTELRPVVDTLRLLADGDGLRDYLDNGNAAGLQAATRRARFVSEGSPDYDQLRYIGADGFELMRVTRGGEAVPPAQLQDRSGREYFRQASVLPGGGIYVSAFDLSEDNGRVETPFRPVLRFAVPVFDSSGRRRGIYIINYLGSNLINHLQQVIPAYGHRLRLLDASGFWIRGADPAQEWGFALPERASSSIARTDPQLWTRIRQQPAGQSEADGRVFTWLHVLPADVVGEIRGELLSAQPFWVMGSEVSPTEWNALFAGLRQVLMFLVPALVLLTLLSAGLFRARRRVLLELRAVNLELEERVRERTAELARSNEELRDRESLLDETGNLAKVGGWEFDPATGKGTWTAEIARIHDLDANYPPSRELGLQFYPGESRTRIEAALARSLADGSPYDLELEFVSAGGVRKWVRTISRPVVEGGRVVRMRGALQDITERKQVELRLHSQLQRLHLLERTTRAIGERQDVPGILQVVIGTLEQQLPLDFGCVCTFDAADRSLTVTVLGPGSLKFADQLGLAVGAQIPVGENGLSRCVQGRLVYEADVTDVSAPFPQRLAAAGLRALVAAPLQAEGRVFGVLMAARLEKDSFSSSDTEFLRQLSEHAALATNQAQLHAALQAAYEDLHNTQQAVMQQERLRVLGQMSSGIAHDINNAISPIMLYTDSLLETEPGLSERARQSLRTIQQAVSDVAETVARMREFYRQREGQLDLQPVPLNTLVMQLRELTRARWETMPQQQGIVIDLRLELEDDLPPVLGIANEMREALVNLIFNAVDAMPSGGTLTIRTRRVAERVWVEVADTGSGMDEETRRRCLEPFFTTKGERGTGLGLAMVYGVMQRHNGEVEIDSAPDAGTIVRLSFGVTQVQAETVAQPAVRVPVGLSILLVDDDPILLRSLREILEIDGHKIDTAGGGQDGIDTFRTLQASGSPPSVVITDLGMPHIDGRAVATAIKQMSPATPVILLTGWGERLLAEGRVVPHVDRVLGKPPRLRDLREALLDTTAKGAAPVH